jgi:hypothetical protein
MTILTLDRLPDWRTRLHEYRQKNLSREFEWGEYDCALRVADVVEVITGHDPASSLRSQYSTALGSLKTLKAQKYNDLPDFLAKNFKEIHPAFAAEGDIALIDHQSLHTGHEEITGHVAALFLRDVIEALSFKGTVILSRTAAARAFRVGL